MAATEIETRFRLADVLPALFTLIAGVIFGGSMVVVCPPFDVPEEWQHFFRAYQVSERQVFTVKNYRGTPGGMMPASMLKFARIIHGNAANEFGFSITPEKFAESAAIPLRPGLKTFAALPSTGRFSPVPYLPAAAALYAGRHARFGPLVLLYMGRASTLVAYLLLVTAAVWLTPVHKWLLAMVALMPTSVFLAASLSADALSAAFTLLAVAMTLRLALRSEAVDRRSLIGLGVVLVLLSLTKPPYNLIALLFLAVSPEKFVDRRQCWRARAWIIVLPIAVSFLWAWVARDAAVPYRPCADVRAQAAWMLANPWGFVERVLARLFDGQLYTGIIAILGWGTVWLASAVYYIYWAALLAAALLDGSHDRLRVPMAARALAVGVYGLVFVAIATLTFLWWQAVGEEVIHGVQPRYFVAMLPLLLLPLRSGAKWAAWRFSRWFVPAMSIVTVLIGMGATWQAEIARFYWR